MQLASGEGEGNFGGALMTSGSFTMMAAGDSDEEEEEEEDLEEAQTDEAA